MAGKTSLVETKTVVIKLPITIHSALERQAQEQYEPLCALIRRLLIQHVRKNEASEGARN